MFLFDDDSLTKLYTLPFLVGLALPGTRLRAIVGSLALAVAILATLTAHGKWAVFGLIFVWTAAGGLCCGVVTRAVTIYLAPLRQRPFRFMGIAAFGYILLPVVFAGPEVTMAWLKRPSLRTCAAATYSVTAAKMTLHVRATPIFGVDMLEGARWAYGRHIWFGSKQALRSICGHELRDHQVVGPAAVNVYPWQFGGSDVQRWVAENCGLAPGETLALICRLADNKHPARKLERATIYGPEMDEVVSRGATYAVEQKLHQRLIDASEPFVFVCEGDETATFDRALLCAAQETIANGLRIKFTFRTNSAQRTADLDAIRAYLRELVASLCAGVSSPSADKMTGDGP